jgi:hypothetical protein
LQERRLLSLPCGISDSEKKEAVDQSMKAYEVCESIKKISYLTRS